MTTKILTATALLLAAAGVQAAEYTVDRAHTDVGFKIRHMMVSNVRGSFSDVDGTFVYEPGKPETWKVEATIETASVDTRDEKRDEHLRSADFFDVEDHPTMTFRSTKIVSDGDGGYDLHGDLTLLGTTRPVVLDLEFLGEVTDPWGNGRVGFTAEGKIDRKDFGMTWSKSLDNGGLVVGNDVEIELQVEGVQKK